MKCDICLEVASNPELLCSVRSLVRSYLSICGLPEEKSGLIVLAVDEACTNSIRHSYQGRHDERIELLFRSETGWIEIELSDNGESASPGTFVKKKFKEPDRDKVKPGGLGVQLMYSVADEVHYYRGKERGNKLIMRFKCPDTRKNVEVESIERES